jgi:hypothetical protein
MGMRVFNMVIVAALIVFILNTLVVLRYLPSHGAAHVEPVWSPKTMEGAGGTALSAADVEDMLDRGERSQFAQAAQVVEREAREAKRGPLASEVGDFVWEAVDGSMRFVRQANGHTW